MQNPKLTRGLSATGFGILLLLLVGCQPASPTDGKAAQSNPDPVVIASATGTPANGQTVGDVADGFDGDVEPTEQAADQRFAGMSSDVADLLERMESCYSLQADARSTKAGGVISADEALELQDQLGCDEIEADIARTLQQHPDQPKVAQLIQQMKATKH